MLYRTTTTHTGMKQHHNINIHVKCAYIRQHPKRRLISYFSMLLVDTMYNSISAHGVFECVYAYIKCENVLWGCLHTFMEMYETFTCHLIRDLMVQINYFKLSMKSMIPNSRVFKISYPYNNKKRYTYWSSIWEMKRMRYWKHGGD